MEKTNKPLKILCITPGNSMMKTPETGFAELLVERGHQLQLQYVGYDTLKVELYRRVASYNPDIIWCMMEYALPTAIVYRDLLKVPVYAHIECIPPWRTGVDPEEDWGFDYEEVKHAHTEPCIIALYKDLLTLFEQADSRTISGEEWRYTLEEFMDKTFDCDVRYYTFDKRELAKYENEFLEEKNQICTISRFDPLKRVHHIMQALAKIDKGIRPKYVLVGYGEEEEYLRNLAKKLDIDVDFVGSGLNGVKYKVLQESMFNVQIVSGIPVLEAGYYSKHTISYDTAHMKEVYGDMCTWVETNNIDALAGTIEKFIKEKKLRIDKGKQSKQIMETGKCNIYTPQEFVEKVEDQFFRAMAEYKYQTKNDDDGKND